MIMNMEECFCKAKEVFVEMLQQVEQDTIDGKAIHEVEDNVWKNSLELGRQILAAHVEMQAVNTPAPDSVQHSGKTLKRLDGKRKRSYHSVFGEVIVNRDVYARREIQRHEVVPLDAKLGLPEGDISYLLQRWCNARSVNGSYAQVRKSITEIFGFAPLVSALEDMACRAGRHADKYFRNQQPIDPSTEDEIIVVTSDCKGVPMRKADAPRGAKNYKPDTANPVDSVNTDTRKRLKKGEKRGQKRMACVGGAYSVGRFERVADDLLDEIVRKENEKNRPTIENKRLRAVLTKEVDGKTINSKDVVFDWLAEEVRQRDPNSEKTIVAIMDGETKLRDLQKSKISRAIGILDIWHVTEYLWKLAHCFHVESSKEAEQFVETYLRKILQGELNRAIGGIRQMATKRKFPEKKKASVKQLLSYFVRRAGEMRYNEYLAAGYPIGSGVVEGACKHLVKDRMELTGMRWRIAGAQTILSLRAIYLNDDWETFNRSRIEAEQARLHPYKTSQPDLLVNAI